MVKTDQVKKQVVNLSLSPDVVRAVDEDRGLVPRSAYIEHILKEALEQGCSIPGVRS